MKTLKIIQALMLSTLMIPGLITTMSAPKQWLLYMPNRESYLGQWELIEPSKKSKHHRKVRYDYSTDVKPPFADPINNSYLIRLKNGYSMNSKDIFIYAGGSIMLGVGGAALGGLLALLTAPHFEYNLDSAYKAGYTGWKALEVWQEGYDKYCNARDARETRASIIGALLGSLPMLWPVIKTQTNRVSYLISKKMRAPEMRIIHGRDLLTILYEDDADALKAACSIDKRFINANDDYSHKNALYYAAQFGSINAFNALEKMGVIPSQNDRLTLLRRYKTKKIETALAKDSLDELKRVLAKKEFDINTQINYMGDSMLSYAIKNDCSYEIIKFLIESGAEICTKNSLGQTIIDLALNHILRPLQAHVETVQMRLDQMRLERIKVIKLLLYFTAGYDPLPTIFKTQDAELKELILEIKPLCNRTNLINSLSLFQREEFARILQKRAQVLGQKIQEHSFAMYPELDENKKVFESAVSPLVGEYLGSIE